MQRGSANISKPPHTNKPGANENERATGIEPAFPETASIPKSDVIQKPRDKGIGEKRARTFLDAHTSASGPIYEWRIKRSGKRDDIHLALSAQPDSER